LFDGLFDGRKLTQGHRTRLGGKWSGRATFEPTINVGWNLQFYVWSTMSNEDDRYIVGGIVRCFEVLRCFDREHPSLSMNDVARILGWRSSEPFRILYTLVALGYLRRDPQTKRYELSTKVLELGFSALANLQLPELCQPYLERLRAQTNGSAHLGILENNEILYIGRVASRSILGSNIGVGSRLAAHATAIGKMLLACKPEAWVRDWLSHNELLAFTPKTFAISDAFLAELANVRERGYAYSDQEFDAGVRSVAAAIRSGNGDAIAAINVSAPITVFSDEDVALTVIPAVRETADEISRACGWQSAGISA
jgi:IclR family transcriptional regulator, pca regulon regulatory protein